MLPITSDNATLIDPGYDQNLREMPPPLPSEGSSEFLDLFRHILGHHTNQQNIRLEEGMESRVVNAAKVAFEMWSRIYRSDRSSASTNSSSLVSQQLPSYLGGSWQHISTPGTGRHRLSTTTPSTGVQSQAFSMDIASSPTGSSMMMIRRSQRDNAVQGMVPSFEQPQSPYDQHAMGGGIPAEHRGHTGFPGGTMNSTVGDPFTNNQMGAGNEQYYAMEYDNTGVAFNDGGNAAVGVNRATGFANYTGVINPHLISSPGNPLHQNSLHLNNWAAPFPNPGHQRYHDGQP
jgi:hypothetical protein